jgi:hypothetical protein
MRLDSTFTLRNSIEDFRHPMADIVTHNILYKQTCQQNTDYRIKQVQVIHPAHIKISGKQMLNQVYQLFQDNRRRCRTYPDQETDYQNKMLFFYMLVPPQQEPVK